MINSALRVLREAAQTARSALRPRLDLVIENLRQQVLALKQNRQRPRLGPADRAFWILLRKRSDERVPGSWSFGEPQRVPGSIISFLAVVSSRSFIAICVPVR